MQKIYLKFRMFAAITVVAFLLGNPNSIAQIAESFEGSMNPATGLPAGWKQVRLGGINVLPNAVARVNAGGIGAYPSASIFNGNYVIKYNTRNVAYPTYNSNVTGQQDKMLLVTRALDWSGRDTATGSNLNRIISFRFYRDASTTGGVNSANDKIEVYINNRADTVGALLLSEAGSGATAIPRSSSLAPTFTGSGWQLLRYNLPAQIPGGGGSKFDTTSSAYVIFKFSSNSSGVGGNNMLMDSISVPEWKTQMIVTHSEIVYKSTNPLLPGSSNNNVVGVRIHTKGSLTAKKVDRFVCYQTGSTDYPTDINAAKCFFTHDSTYFLNTGLQLPLSTGANTIPPLDFGYWTSPCTFTTPADFTLSPGSDNYVWLALDVNYNAGLNNVVSLTPAFFYAGSSCATQVMVINPVPVILNISYDMQYQPPVYQYGTSFSNSNYNDFISAVNMVGENGTELNNWYHDVNAPACTQNCDRFASHPIDYTFFNPANAGLNKSRAVTVTYGRGKRSADSSLSFVPYQLKIAAGTNPTNNYVHVWIDWNADGDFNDVYYLFGGLKTDSIFEDYGFRNLDSGNMVTPFASKFGTWEIHVPLPTDSVTDIVKLNGSNDPIKAGLIRMRIVDSYGVDCTDPINSILGYGETEDYTLILTDPEICPLTGLNVSRWLGVNTEWNDAANWCPAIPTLNDIAYIPAMSALYKYPDIDSGTVASCRSLKIADGAHVDISCNQNGQLRVADSLIIGVGTLTANSYIKVSGAFSKSVTIPGQSVAPPSGNGFVPQSLFQVVPNLKLQIAYSASELSQVYGWKPGDIIDSLTFRFRTTTGATVSFSNYRIVYYSVSTPVTWSNPSPINTDIAVRSGYPGIVSGPHYLIGNATGGITITMNEPNNGLSYYSIALNQNSFVWDGNNVVLSFEYWSPSTAGKGNYVLYTEPSGTYNVLAIKSNTGAAAWNTITSGYGLSGYQRSLISPFNNASILSTGSIASNCASNVRPRIDFALRRNTARFPITVGKTFVNNNPTGIIAGANGFIAGNSLVSFDPTIRNTVNSPGLSQTDSIINPTPQPANLTQDTMFIASGLPTIDGTAQTIFNELVVRGADSGPSYTLKQKLESFASYLNLVSGEFNLNRNTFTLLTSKPGSLTSTFGWIRSENGQGTINSIFTWKIGTDTGTYSVPFGLTKNNIFPFTYKAISGDVGDLSLATYKTTNTNNTILPISPVTVLNMNNLSNINVGDSCVDRFWLVQRNTFGPLSNSVTFRYNNTNEGTSKSAYASNQMKVIRYAQYGVNWRWCRTNNWPNQTDALNGSIASVTVALNDSIKSNNWLIYTVQKATCVATTPTVTNSGPLTFCNGDSVQLTSSLATAYKWSSGETSQSINVKTSGTYTVTVYNSTGCSAKSTGILVTVNNKPPATITTSGPTTFCSGDSVVLTTANAASYLWSSGATTKSITVKVTGTYVVTVTNAAGCSNSSSPVVTTKKSLPSATISLSGPSTFCQGGNVVLTCSSAASYLWSTGATSQSITATASGTYTVTATSAFGCTKKSSPMVITVKALPTATVTPAGPTTFCNGDSVVLNANTGGTLAYQWRKNGNNIANAINASYTAKTAGSYLVIVTNNNGCSKTSNTVVVTVNCKEDVSGNSLFNMYPNPATGLVYVEMNHIADETSTVTLLDIAGRTVTINVVKLNDSQIAFDAANLADGTYTIIVKTKEGSEQQILVVTH